MVDTHLNTRRESIKCEDYILKFASYALRLFDAFRMKIDFYSLYSFRFVYTIHWSYFILFISICFGFYFIFGVSIAFYEHSSCIFVCHFVNTVYSKQFTKRLKIKDVKIVAGEWWPTKKLIATKHTSYVSYFIL